MPKQEGTQRPEEPRNTPYTKDGQEKVGRKKRTETAKNSKEDRERLRDKRRAEGSGRFASGAASRDIPLVPRQGETKPVARGSYDAAALKIQELRDAPNGSKKVDFTRRDRLNFEQVLEGAGFELGGLVRMDNAELINLAEEVINGRIKGAAVKVLPSKTGETKSPVQSLLIKKASDSGEEDLTVEAIRGRLLPGKDGNSRIVSGGAATNAEIITGGVAVADLTPTFRNVVGDIQLYSDFDTTSARARGKESAFKKLEQIEDELEKALRDGTIDAAEPGVESTRVWLREFLNTEMPAFRVERYREQEKMQGQIDFDEQFGDAFKRTKECIESRDGAGLVSLMREAKAEVEKIITLVGFDVDNDTTWPTDIDVRKVFEVSRAINKQVGEKGRSRIESIIGTSIADVSLLSEFISSDRTLNLVERLNIFYGKIYANLSPARIRAIVGDINDSATLAIGSISQGWTEFNPRMKRLFDLFNEKQFKDIVTNNFTGEGLVREWRGLSAINGVEQGVELAQLTQPPDRWQDIPSSLNKLIAYIEPSGLSIESLQPTLNAAFGMLNRIDQSTSFGRGMYAELKERLEAFKFKHSLVITAHTKAMDPEALGHVFLNDMEGTKEETFTAMIGRFARDAESRRFYATKKDVDGTTIGTPVELNLFDVGKKLYSQRLQAERVKMNMVEEMTRYSIAGPFDAHTIGRIKDATGFGYLIAGRTAVQAAAIEADWLRDLEATRVWLKERVEKKITSSSPFQIKYVDSGGNRRTRTATIDDWGNDEGDLRHGITKAVVQDWYERKTVHGAFGVIDEEGLEETAEELKDLFRKTDSITGPLESDSEVKARIKKMLGEETTWIHVRRAEMRQRILKELEDMGLTYDRNAQFGDQHHPDLRVFSENEFSEYLDDLMESGYIGAVESNVYDLTWVFEWSTYEFIHIYGRKPSKFDDDYKALVQTRSTDGYYAKIVDHNWEYVHEDFEDRGRGRINDVNQVFMQYFPGKHHWVFGHVSMATRFIESFIDGREREMVESRTDELVRQYDFHNEKYEASFRDYMRSVAIRELIVAGAISFADRKYSDVVKERGALNKFNPVDNADDRKRLKEFMSFGNFQAYLSNPDGSKYQAIVQKDKVFPSTRDPRLFPWQEFGLKAHWEVVHNLNKKFFNEADITNKQMENFVDEFVAEGSVEKEQGEKFKRKNLGMGPGILGRGFFRTVRAIFWDENKQKGQIEGRKKGWALLILLMLFNPIRELFKGAFNEAKRQ